MNLLRALRPHPAIVKPVAALAIAVWILVGSVAYLVVQQRDTAGRVARLEAFEQACLTSKPDTPRCDELYDSLISSLSVEQLRELNRRLAVSSR